MSFSWDSRGEPLRYQTDEKLCESDECTDLLSGLVMQLLRIKLVSTALNVRQAGHASVVSMLRWTTSRWRGQLREGVSGWAIWLRHLLLIVHAPCML